MNKGVPSFWIVETETDTFHSLDQYVDAVFSHFDDAKEYVDMLIDQWHPAEVEWLNDKEVKCYNKIRIPSPDDVICVTVRIKNGQGGPVKKDLLGPCRKQ